MARTESGERMTEGTAHISPDGRWAWDGQQWVATSPEPAATAAASGYPGPVGPSRTDGKAIASLVLGLLWLAGLGSIAAVVLGHLSRSEAKREGRAPSGLALAGLILGYIGGAFLVLGVLAAIAIPVFLNQREKGYETQVKSDLREVAVLEETYFTDNNTYTGNPSELSFKPTGDDDVSIVSASADGYCLQGSHVGSTKIWYYNSESGLSRTPCS